MYPMLSHVVMVWFPFSKTIFTYSSPCRSNPVANSYWLHKDWVGASFRLVLALSEVKRQKAAPEWLVGTSFAVKYGKIGMGWTSTTPWTSHQWDLTISQLRGPQVWLSWGPSFFHGKMDPARDFWPHASHQSINLSIHPSIHPYAGVIVEVSWAERMCYSAAKLRGQEAAEKLATEEGIRAERPSHKPGSIGYIWIMAISGWAHTRTDIYIYTYHRYIYIYTYIYIYITHTYIYIEEK